MKHTLKKVAALVLAVLMCVSVMVPSLSAATCPGKGQTHSTTNCTYTVTETAATCKTSGSRVATCNVCADTVFVQTIDATGAHDWEMPAATCVAGAKKVCKVCKTSEPVTKTNHTWSAWTLTAVSVCTVGENVRRTCTGCGAKESVMIPEEGHYFELSSYIAPVSCAVPGTATYLCVIKGCGATKTVEIEATDASHTYVSWAEYYEGVANAPADPNYVDSTCAAPGTMTVICKDCARKAVIAINDLKDHVWRSPSVEAVPAKCDVKGTAKYTLCVNCRLYKAETASDKLAVDETTTNLADLDIAPLHNNPTVYGEVLPTCTTAGTRLVKCPLQGNDNCGWVSTIELKALGAHVYYPDVTDVAAQKEIMKKLGITGTTWAELDDFSATPSANQAKIWASYTAATCDKDAVVVWKCLNCAEKLYNVSSAQYVQCTTTKEATPAGNDFVKKGHNYDVNPDAATATYPAATCTTPGVDVYTCKNGCGTPKIVNVAPLGHRTYVDKTDADYVAPTCKEAGTNVIKCYNTGCTYKTTEPAPSTGNEHIYQYLKADGSAWVNTAEVAPTCTNEAVVTRRCTVADCPKATPETVTLPAKGHTYMDVTNATVAKDLAKLTLNATYTDAATGSVATCIAVGGCENGYKYSIKCADCAMFKYHEVTEGFGGGHVKVYINGTAVAATCTTPELSNKWYCKNSFCEYYCEKYEDAVAAAKLATLPQDTVAAPNHKLWDEKTDAPAQTAVTYKDVPYAAIKDAKDLAKASAIEAPVDAKGNVTRYVAIPGTTLIWVFKYTPANHTEAAVTAGGFYCTECTYSGTDKAVYTAATAHTLVKTADVKEASCLTYGYELWACSAANCFYAVQKNYAPVADHDDVLKKAAAADCTMTGYALYECADCGRIRTEHKPALGHNTDANRNGTVITSSCLDAAATRVCAICKVTVQKVHTGEVGTNCKVCQVVIPAK